MLAEFQFKKLEGKGLLVRPKCRWEGNVETEKGCDEISTAEVTGECWLL